MLSGSIKVESGQMGMLGSEVQGHQQESGHITQCVSIHGDPLCTGEHERVKAASTALVRKEPNTWRRNRGVLLENLEINNSSMIILRDAFTSVNTTNHRKAIK